MSGSDDEDFEENVTTAVKVATQIGKTTKGKKHTGKSLDDVVTKKFEVGETSKKRQLEKTVRLKIGNRKDENAKKKVLAGHGSPAPLYELISMLTVAQKIDVEDIGFGGHLELKAKAFYHFMIDWLVEYYDHVSQMLLISEHNKFVITKHDVYDVFMLPCTEKTVKLTSNKKKDNPDTELVTLWRENFNVGPKDEISLERVKEEMLKLVEGGADFKKLFVIYAMGTFLAPTVHNRADLRLVTAVEDVAQIGQQDWCSYVLDRLNFAVKSWRLNNSKSIGGCLFFLQLVYFHRLTWRGSPSKSTLPLLQHWTYEGLKKRMSEEMEAYSLNRGCFGIGTLDHNTYPVSLNQPKRFYRLSTKVATISEEEDDDIYLKIKLPSGVLSDRQLRQKYSDFRLQKWMTTKRNLELVARLHDNMARELEAFEEGLVQTQHEAVLSTRGDDIEQPSQLSWTQALKDPSFLAEFHAVGRKVDEFIAIQLVEPPSFDLGLGLGGNVCEKESGTSKTVVAEKRVDRKVTIRYTRAAVKKGAEKTGDSRTSNVVDAAM
ncbi:hypothetical protein RND81_01G106700 [Saponaria officinalis]|uniref:Uncharacterized protein n=1 Tax=Saponaria officinalis TaxID=3572 RepID=A0AAW1N9C3_SAPOF